MYLYNGKIPIPALAMVDDIIYISPCNTAQSIKNNIQTDEFINMKKLEGQVGDGKWQWLHIDKKQCESSYIINGKKTKKCEKYCYLGDHVSDGWEPLYRKRYETSQLNAVSCQAMCPEISLRYQFYSIAKMIHQAIFLR